MPGNQCEGILCPLLKYLSNSLNFTFSLKEEPNGIGFETHDKQWIGFMGNLQRNVNYFFSIHGN